MAKKKDGITDLTKVLVLLAGKLTPKEFKKVRDVCFALLHGVNYGYTELGPKFLQDADDLYLLHHDDKWMKDLDKKIKRYMKKDNVIYLSDYIEVKKNDA